MQLLTPRNNLTNRKLFSTDLLALLSQGAQCVHDLLSLGSIYKASTEC